MTDPKDAERLTGVMIGGTHLCQHGIMARTCGLCERDVTIDRLTKERDELKHWRHEAQDVIVSLTLERDDADGLAKSHEEEIEHLQSSIQSLRAEYKLARERLMILSDVRVEVRRAERELCAQQLEARAIDIRDRTGARDKEGLLTGIAGVHVGCLLDAAAMLRGRPGGTEESRSSKPSADEGWHHRARGTSSSSATCI